MINAFSAHVYPNPSSGHFTVTFNSSGETVCIFNITDMTGKVLIRENYNAVPGINARSFDLGSLAKGLYMIHLQNKDATQVLRISLQ